VRASDATVALLRRYCRARGIPLPYRGDPAFGQKDRGLLDALRAASRGAGRASSTLLVSDLEALEDWDAIHAELRRMVGRGARVEERRVRGIEARLASLGIAVVRVSPRDVPALIFSRAALLRAS
jgi:hypothetical protein